MSYESLDIEIIYLEIEEEFIFVNIRGKRRFLGGYVSTRRIGFSRKKESCICCRGIYKYDFKSLKRLVFIDSSRFNSKRIIIVYLLYYDFSEDSDCFMFIDRDWEEEIKFIKRKRKKKNKGRIFLD